MKKALLVGALTLAASITANATPIHLSAHLSNAGEPPAAASSLGTGIARVNLNDAGILRVHVRFSNLSGDTIASHIHCCTLTALTGNAGVATEVPSFPGFPLGVKAGVYDETFDLNDASSFNPAFVTANGGTAASALQAFASGLGQGKAYLNIHSTLSTGGEIRGFLTPVPAPAGMGLFALALAALGISRRRQV